MSVIKGIQSTLIDLKVFALAPKCQSCGLGANRSANLCLPCYNELPSISYSQCLMCANSLSATGDELICGQCLKSPPPYTRTFSLFPYQAPIKQWIARLKFTKHLNYAKTFADLFCDRITNDWYRTRLLPEIIVPVPLHPKRLQERGFNQALEMAKPIAKQLKLKVVRDHVQRTVHTAPQSGLSALERKENLYQAFATPYTWAGCSVAVIDDVITTGETMRSLCKVLQERGANQIDVWCCARR